jgi:HD-like signal output (HDOD) protein
MSENPPLSDKELADAVDQLPPVVSVMWRLLGVLRDPDSDVDNIARLVRVDTALAAQVLRLANSPHYGLVERVASVEAAIQHIGINETTRLVTTLSSREVFTRALARYSVSASLLWQHTLAVAVGAEAVAEHFGNDGGLAYIAGLLHPIGLVALDSVGTARNLPARSGGGTVLEWEQAQFGGNNASVAARVLLYWCFPADLVASVAARYEPPTAETAAQAGRELFLASAFAERVPAGLPVENGLFRLPAELLEEIGLGPERYSELALIVQQRLTHMRALLGL